jgi:hypothetical protein
MMEIFSTPTTNDQPERRHVQRWRPQIELELYVCGYGLGSHPFCEQPRLIEVSANGAFFEMNCIAPEGQRLLLVNKATAEEQECSVVYVYHSESLSVKVAVAFASPNRKFWHMPSISKPSPGVVQVPVGGDCALLVQSSIV